MLFDFSVLLHQYQLSPGFVSNSSTLKKKKQSLQVVIKRSLNDPGRCQQSIDLQTSARQNKSDTAPPWITDASLQQHVVQPSAQRDNSCLCVSFGIVETEHPVPALRTYFWSHASRLCGPDFIAQLTSEKILWFNQVEKAIFFPIWTCVFFPFPVVRAHLFSFQISALWNALFKTSLAQFHWSGFCCFAGWHSCSEVLVSLQSGC